MTQDVQIAQVGIDDLRPDPANPRRIGDEELESLTRAIREFGFVDPIIARKEDKTVIGGHQRLVAARRLGLKTVPVVYVDLSQEQARLLNLSLNKISGSWDQELLARLLADLEQSPDVDLTLSGFGEDEIKKLLKSLDSREKQERVETFDSDAALEATQSSTVAHTGDLWLLGDHPAMRRQHGTGGRGSTDGRSESRDCLHGPALQRLLRQSRRRAPGRPEKDRRQR